MAQCNALHFSDEVWWHYTCQRWCKVIIIHNCQQIYNELMRLHWEEWMRTQHIVWLVNKNDLSWFINIYIYIYIYIILKANRVIVREVTVAHWPWSLRLSITTTWSKQPSQGFGSSLFKSLNDQLKPQNICWETWRCLFIHSCFNLTDCVS